VKMPRTIVIGAIVTAAVAGLGALRPLPAQLFRARDPGVRGGAPGAGPPLAALTASELAFFTAGQEEFDEAEGVADGLGPRFNLDSCVGCHSQPAPGGSSPAGNPQAAIVQAFPGNVLPAFVTPGGPVREVRFRLKPDGTRDGGVHALFVITGHPAAAGCTIVQEDFAAQVAARNVSFRIPTPMFGAGLIEAIPDYVILANQATNAAAKSALGIRGRPNRQAVSGIANTSGNDGTIARFGWKAQNKSLLLFAGEAYNVEMGISNELFQSERDETPSCQFASAPNDATRMEAPTGVDAASGIVKFAAFMRFLAPPAPAPATASTTRGRAVFDAIGCALCHTPTLQTGEYRIAALANQPVNLFSDLLLHAMGAALADEIVQGQAGPDEFRTAPLWGLGQRIFFLHDGRTTDLIQAILAHRSPATLRYPASEANGAVARFLLLGEADRQHLLDFLRSL